MYHFDASSVYRPGSCGPPDWVAMNLIGESPAFLDMLDVLQQWAAVDATVLLCGETGTGKELAAHAIHYLGRRCASHGLVGQAEGGTLFLDEVDALSARAQAAILRFVEDRSYRPVGGSCFHQADVRLIAATNADLQALSSKGRFRHDLVYRLDLLTLRLPPLRVRAGDPLLLAESFVRRFCVQYGMPGRRLEPASRASLEGAYHWPGNVRELEHRVHRRFLSGAGPLVDLGLAPAAPAELSGAHPHLPFAAAKARSIAEFERNYVSNLLTRTNGNLSEAARLAGKDRSRLGRLVKSGRISTVLSARPSPRRTRRRATGEVSGRRRLTRPRSLPGPGRHACSSSITAISPAATCSRMACAMRRKSSASSMPTPIATIRACHRKWPRSTPI